MIEAIGKNGIIAAEQGSNDAEIGHVAAGEQQRRRQAAESGQCLLQSLVQAMVACKQMRRATTDASLRRALLQGGDKPGVIGQSQIIVAAEG